MIKLSRFTRLTVIGAISALLLGTLAACSQGSSPHAKKVLMACLAVTNIDASQILGSQLTAFKLSGENSPIHVCEYNDAQDDTHGLIQITKSASKDPAANLAADAAQVKVLFKSNITPIQVHAAKGFGNGAFYVDNTQSPTASSVQLHFIENGYKMMVQVNDPKDFATGEKQAAAMAQKALADIQNGSAFQAL